MDIIGYTIEKKIPLAVQLNLTNRCNLRCLHCCLSQRKGKDEDEFSDERSNDHPELNQQEIGHLLEEVAKAGCLILTLSGGEVMFREDLLDIIGLARGLDFAVKVFTNGTMLSQREAKAFKKLNVQEVHISLYAAREGIHDGITRVPGSWQKSIEAIRLLREENILVKIKCALMRQNVAEYHQVYDLAVALGTGYAFDPVITARDNGKKDTLNYRISQDDLQKILNDPLFRQVLEGEDKDRFACQSQIYDQVLCSAGHNVCFISPSGEVNPCVQLPISCGNIRQQGFAEIWHHSPALLSLRNLRMQDVRECKGCEYIMFCARCPGLAYLEDGDLLGPSSAACWMTRARIMEEKSDKTEDLNYFYNIYNL